MQSIFITGTAGSGKSILTSILTPWYHEKGASVASVNLDPGASALPYTPDIDIRDFIDMQAVMDQYQLGPNGALVLTSDLIATRIAEIQEEIDSISPDYVIIDTPGQMELFAYRTSGPFFVDNLLSEAKAVIFLFDSTLVSTPANFVSIALLAASLQLRLKAPQIPVLSKRDLVGDRWKTIMKWSSNARELETAISNEENSQHYLLSTNLLRGLVRAGFSYELIPYSGVTREGIVELSATLGRILKGGEEVED